ncbi:MAG: VWA-like domain-containing protein [Syntrophobacteraceae bacterium]
MIAVDTSGSVDVSDLDQFCGEVNAILEEYDTKANVLYCDTAVAAVQVFTRDNLPLRLNALGGGGTDFRPPFEWVAENGIRPAALIHLTDLECRRFPEEEPPYPVLWTRIGTWGRTPPFGEILEVV